MSWIEIATIIGIVAVVALAIVYFKSRRSDRLDEIIKTRFAGSKVASKADFVEGNQHIPVAIALMESSIRYENSDLQAFIDLSRIDEVEYVGELTTGVDVPEGRVLRLRSHGHTFEFVVSRSDAAKWEALLPPHRMDEPGSVHAV